MSVSTVRCEEQSWSTGGASCDSFPGADGIFHQAAIRPCPSQESLYTLARAISDFMLAHMLHLTKLALPGRAFVKRLRRRVEHADETDL